jgi:hypothetical protein
VAEPFGRDDWSAQRRIVSDGADAAHVGRRLSLLSPLVDVFAFRELLFSDSVAS